MRASPRSVRPTAGRTRILTPGPDPRRSSAPDPAGTVPGSPCTSHRRARSRPRRDPARARGRRASRRGDGRRLGRGSRPNGARPPPRSRARWPTSAPPPHRRPRRAAPLHQPRSPGRGRRAPRASFHKRSDSYDSPLRLCLTAQGDVTRVSPSSAHSTLREGLPRRCSRPGGGAWDRRARAATLGPSSYSSAWDRGARSPATS